MLKTLRSKHPILFCILAEVLLIAFLQLGGVVSYLIMVLLGPVLGHYELIDILSGPLDVFSEMFGAMLAVFILLRTWRGRLLTQRGCGFFNGMLVGMWMLTIIAYNLIVSFYNPPENARMNPLWDIFWYFAYMLAVGAAEELIGRAVIAETLLEHFGTARAGIWKACLLSGLLFGCGHLINIFAGSELTGVLVQCGSTALIGMMITAIYFRTGNIWAAVVLHWLNNISASWNMAIYSSTTFGELVGSYSFSMLLPAVVMYALPVLFLLRKKRIGEVELYFGRWCGAKETK